MERIICKCLHLKLLAFEKLIFSRSGYKLILALISNAFRIPKVHFLLQVRRSDTLPYADVECKKLHTFNYKLNTKLNLSEIGCRKRVPCVLLIHDSAGSAYDLHRLPNNP